MTKEDAVRLLEWARRVLKQDHEHAKERMALRSSVERAIKELEAEEAAERQGRRSPISA
jgi:hypothetical protein